MFINAIHMYRTAIYMLESVVSSIRDREPNQPEALTSIIFAGITLETFINELPAVLKFVSLDKNSPSWLTTFIEVSGQLEQSRVPIRTKYSVAKFVLSGASF
jgi:hypothetical protein